MNKNKTLAEKLKNKFPSYVDIAKKFDTNPNYVGVFNIGQRLNPIEPKDGGAIISSFMLFNDDKSEAELFLPNTQGSIILKTTDKKSYENGEYKFDTTESTLYINDEKKYKAE